MYQGYGLTETSPVVTLNPFHRVKMASIGVPVPGTDVRLVNDRGEDVPLGEPGELLVRGPQVMQGYWQRPDETARMLKDGWLATGDIATMDAEGYLSIVDRKKDMILVSGFNVYPERGRGGAGRSIPALPRSAIIGAPDPLCGEAVVAFIVRRDPALDGRRSAPARARVAHQLQGPEDDRLPRRAAQVERRQGSAQGLARGGGRRRTRADSRRWITSVTRWPAPRSARRG